MTARKSFRRKIIYLVVLAVLLILLYGLGNPAVRATDRPGGLLAQLREQHGLSQTQLGEVDPTGEAIKLASLGLRGVAANILWGKAIEYKKKKDWTNLSATVNQITKIQPNFISVWLFNGWNLSYNVSVEFEQVRERYHWVMRGIEFLREGIRYNEREPRLLWEIGWVLSNKIGKADERRQYRYLFKHDDDFNEGLPERDRDNWLVGKTWFQDAEARGDKYGVKMKGKGPLIYRSNAPMCQMYYCDAIEKEGTFGDVARRQWNRAHLEWREYGDKDIPTGSGVEIRLNDKEVFDENARELIARIDAISPEIRQQLRLRKVEALTDEHRQAMETKPEDRSAEQQAAVAEAELLTKVTYDEVARAIPRDKRKEALQLARQVAENQRNASRIARSRYIVNFDYWLLRAELEQTDDALAARKLVFDGNVAFGEGDLTTAKQRYDEGLLAWRRVFDAFPAMINQPTFGSDLIDLIDRYTYLLGQLDEEFPADFPLQDIIEIYGDRQ